MARAKLPRKSTAIDMTPFCDVAFLLLTFFILTTKFKPDEKIPINTPSSVSAKAAPQKNFIMISLTKDGKAFLNSDRIDIKESALDEINKEYNLGLTPNDIHRIAVLPVIGTSFQNLKAYSNLKPAQLTAQSLPGIPIKDSSDNQLSGWMKAISSVQQDIMGDNADNSKLTLLLKGDNLSKFPEFKNVILAFTTNNILQFQMVTNPEAIPTGTALWERAQQVKATAVPAKG